MAISGTDVLVYVNTGTAGSPAYTVVGSQRNVTIQEGVAEIDVSHKSDADQLVIGGRYSSKITLGALYVPSDAAYASLKTAFRARALILVQVFESGVAKEKANCLITDMTRDAPDQAEAVISLSLTVSDGWSAV